MSLIANAASLIARYNVGPLTLYRPGAKVQNAFGGFDEPTNSQIAIDPVYSHTASGEDLELLPEADRSKETRIFGAQQALQVGDRIVYQGKTYRLLHVEDRNADGGVYLATGQLETNTGAPS